MKEKGFTPLENLNHKLIGVRNRKFLTGFTLLEVIIAVFILTTAIGGSFVLVNQTLSLTGVTQSKLIASYLVQEGIEVIRNIRDTNWLQGNNWDANISATTSYALDYKSSGFPDPICTGQYLKFDPTDHYNCSSGLETTKFKRRITVSKIGDDQMRITVEVSWPERGREHRAEGISYLYNWY